MAKKPFKTQSGATPKNGKHKSLTTRTGSILMSPKGDPKKASFQNNLRP